MGVQGSLLGSILSNLLLVLGMCFFFGGVKYKTQAFNADGANAQSNMLLLAVLAMVIPTISMFHKDHVSEEEKESVLHISRISALVLGVVYLQYLVFQLYTHPEHFESEGDEPTGGGDDEEEASMSPGMATVTLAASTLLTAA